MKKQFILILVFFLMPYWLFAQYKTMSFDNGRSEEGFTFEGWHNNGSILALPMDLNVPYRITCTTGTFDLIGFETVFATTSELFKITTDLGDEYTFFGQQLQQHTFSFTSIKWVEFERLSNIGDQLNTYIDNLVYKLNPPCSTPTSQVSDISFGELEPDIIRMTGWTEGVGGADGYVAYINTSPTFTAPVDGEIPVKDFHYKGGQHCFYNNEEVATWATVMDLEPATTYYVKVYAYNFCRRQNMYETVGTMTQVKTANPLPEITWDKPSEIPYGDALSLNELDAVAKKSGTETIISGSYNYTPALGTFLPVGTHTLELEFIPNDLGSFSTVTKSVQISVTKKTLTITPEDKSREYGVANPEFTFNYSGFVNGDDASSLDELPTAICSAVKTSDVGTYWIEASHVNDNNYYFDYKHGELTVNKAVLTITAEDKTREYGEENPEIMLSYSGFKNGEDKNSLGTIPFAVCDAYTTSNVGEYDISVSYIYERNYEINRVKGKLTIAKAPVTVTANNIIREYGESYPSLSLSYSGFKNGQTESYINTIPKAVCVADNNSAAGNYDITITPGSDDNYELNYVNGVLTINRIKVTVTAENKSRAYGELNPELTMQFSGFINGDDKDVLDKLPEISTIANSTSSVGKYDILVANGSDDNYDFQYEKGELTVNKAILNVTADNKSRKYGENNPSLTLNYSGFKNSENIADLNLAPHASTIATNFSNSGTYDIIVNEGSDSNYDFQSNNGILTIENVILTLKPNNETKIYGDENPDFTINCSGFVNGENEQVFIEQPSISTIADIYSNVGVYEIIIDGGSTDNYTFQREKGTLTINKATLTVQAENKNRAYGDINPELTMNYSGFKNSDDSNDLDSQPLLSTTATLTSPVGEYDIIISGGSDTNYNLITAKAILNIEKADLKVTANNQMRVYGYDNPALTLSFTGFKNEEDESVLDESPSVSTIANLNSNVGSYDITVSGGQDNNYNIIYTNGSLTVIKASLSVAANNNNRLYGEENPVTSLTYFGFRNGESANVLDQVPSVRYSADILSDAGTYSIIPENGIDNNYEFSYFNATLTVNKANLQVVAENKFREYGDDNPEFTLEFNGFKNNDSKASLDQLPEISCNSNNESLPGIYDITLSGGADNNYNLQLSDGNLTVTKAKLSITAENKSKEYADANPKLTFTIDGFRNGQDQTVIDILPQINTTAIQNSNAGNYDITFSEGSDDIYNFEYVKGVLSINKAALNVTIDDKSREYGQENPEFTYTIEGFKNGEDESVIDEMPQLSTIAEIDSDFGTYNIIISSGSDNNYSLESTNGTLYITKATAELSFSNENQTYDGLAKQIEVTSDPENLNVDIIYNGKSDIPINAGTYEVFILINDTNYEGQASTTLNISKAVQVITFDELETEHVGDEPFTLTAASSSQLDIEYTSSDPSVATIEGNVVKVISAGTTTITASQSGNNNYLMATAVSQDLKVETSTGVDKNYVSEIKIYPNPTTGLVYIDCGEFNNDNCKLKVISVSGTIIYESELNNMLQKIDLTSYTKGVYIIRIEIEGNSIAKRIIVE